MFFERTILAANKSGLYLASPLFNLVCMLSCPKPFVFPMLVSLIVAARGDHVLVPGLFWGAAA